jgi:copper transport protein
MRKRLAFLLFLAVALWSPSQTVSAHAIPLACLPRIGITVAKPPAQVICQFSDPLNPANISMIVTDSAGQRVDKNDVRFYEDDDHTLVVSLDPGKMSQGIYTVKWQVLDTVDQGLTNGEFQFGVNAVVPPTPTAVLPGVAMTPTPVQPTGATPTELISRFLIVVGGVLLLAVGVLYWRMRASSNMEQE